MSSVRRVRRFLLALALLVGCSTESKEPAAPTTTGPPTTVDPLAALREIEAGSCDEVISREVTATEGIYTARSVDGFDEDLTKNVARSCITNLLDNVKKAGMPAEWTQVTVRIVFDLVDKFGAVKKDSEVITATFLRATVERIEYDNIDPHSILLLADLKQVHPAFSNGDGS